MIRLKFVTVQVAIILSKSLNEIHLFVSWICLRCLKQKSEHIFSQMVIIMVVYHGTIGNKNPSWRSWCIVRPDATGLSFECSKSWVILE